MKFCGSWNSKPLVIDSFFLPLAWPGATVHNVFMHADIFNNSTTCPCSLPGLNQIQCHDWGPSGSTVLFTRSHAHHGVFRLHLWERLLRAKVWDVNKHHHERKAPSLVNVIRHLHQLWFSSPCPFRPLSNSCMAWELMKVTSVWVQFLHLLLNRARDSEMNAYRTSVGLHPALRVWHRWQAGSVSLPLPLGTEWTDLNLIIRWRSFPHTLSRSRKR